MNRILQSHLALFAVNFIYGVNFLVAKGLMPDLIGPSGFIVIRVAGATILFWILWLMFVREKITDRKDLKLVAICAFFGVAVNQLLFFNGLCITSPVNASIIMVSTPILVLLMSAVIVRERISGRKMTGVLLGAGGAVALIISRGGSGSEISSVAGDVMVFINAFSYAVYFVIVRPLMKKYKPLTVISYVFLFAVPMVLPFGWKEFTEVGWSGLRPGELLAISFVVLFVTFLAYLMNTFALKYVSASVSSVYIYIQPVIATFSMYIAAAAGWGPPADLTLAKVMCGMLIFTGVFLVSRPARTQKAQN